jgi:hypothetical protein
MSISSVVMPWTDELAGKPQHLGSHGAGAPHPLDDLR